ncbi:MAG: choice-of-anchor D domain-containing protein, partial [Phycisphaerae bacterium]
SVHISSSILTAAEVSVGVGASVGGVVTYEVRADAILGALSDVGWGLPWMVLDKLQLVPEGDFPSGFETLSTILGNVIDGDTSLEYVRLVSNAAPEIDVERGGSDDVHSHSFGQVTVGQSASQSFTIRNEGDAPLTVSQASGLGGPFSINPVNGAGSGDDWVIADGATQEFIVTYQPTSSDESNATLVLANDDGDESSYEIHFSGTGVENWQPYVPSAGETEIDIAIGDSIVESTVTVNFPTSGYRVSQWGDVQYQGGQYVVSILAEQSVGSAYSQVVTPLSHTYSFATPDPGSHEFVVTAWSQYVDAEAFVVAAVAGRHAFYNNSPMDGSTTGASSQDDAAIAADKQALMPGETGSGANCTAYSRGLNGIMVDIDGLADPDGLNLSTIGDYFGFKVGTDDNPDGWATAPGPVEVDVRSVGGSSRVTIIWADNAMEKQWLQVTVKSGPATGLPNDDVFYFGNMPGDATGDGVTNAEDLLKVRQNYRGPASAYPGADYNMDGVINAIDLLAVRQNYRQGIDMISTPAAPTGMAMMTSTSEAQAEPLLAEPVTAQTAPAVEQVQVVTVPTSTVPSVTISAVFSQPVSVAPAALEVVSPVGLKIELPGFQYEPVTRTATWSTAELTDGLYQGAIRSSNVVSDGVSMVRDPQFRFRLNSGIITEIQEDTNGDGIIDLLDLVVL